MSFLTGIQSLISEVQAGFSDFSSWVSDIDFSILWSWLRLPSDLTVVLVALVGFSILLSVLGLIHKIVTLGG